MTTYRRMRRQARQARRSGLQPMMVINSGEPFPETAGVVLLRWAWRYRSELAPLGVTARHRVRRMVAARRPAALVAIGPRHRWRLAAWALVTFGARFGILRADRAPVCGHHHFAAGGWISAATAIGPFTSPLPQALAIGALILSVPWWAHRRRRAKVRVERKLQAWPDIAKAIGLAGSQVMSATVDVWGWRARFRLARGQTIADVVAKIPAIESGLGTFRGAVRVYPTPDDLANRCEIRVLDVDPHAGSIPWPGPSVTSITQPIDLGPFEDASPCRVLFMRRHGLFGGTTGSGKSGGLNVLMGNLVACRDVVIWAIDLKKGMELGPWESCIARLATTPEQAIALLRDAVAVLEARAELLAATGKRTWEISPDMPALVIIIDEYAELADEAPDAMSDTDSIARLGRAVAVTLIAATQRPTQKAMGQGAVRSQMDLRICFRVREPRTSTWSSGRECSAPAGTPTTSTHPENSSSPHPSHDTPKRARAYLLTDQVVADTAAHYAGNRPELDQESQRAIIASSNPRPSREGNSAGDSGSPDAGQSASADGHDSRRRAMAGALCMAPEEGTEIGELMRITG